MILHTSFKHGVGDNALAHDFSRFSFGLKGLDTHVGVFSLMVYFLG